MSYNLLLEPWIDVINSDDSIESVGLIKLFKNAHCIKDFVPVVFHGVSFPLYNYCALRLCCGILADAYNEAEEEFDANDLLRKQKFDMTSGSILDAYFKKYEDRFDLFDKTHPFMQANAEDLKIWEDHGCTNCEKDNLVMLNPCAPADSGRITEVKPEEMKKIIQAFGCDSPSPLYGFNVNDVDSKALKSVIADVYAVPAKEWAYICLYQNCIAPGVGGGNKAAIAGNAYYTEVLQGKDLFRTITMNSVSVALSENRTTNKPIWRWESNTSLFFRPKEVSLDHLSGLFCPSKVIAAKKVENNIVKSVVQSPLRFGKNDDNILEDLRQKWAISFEPHCVVNYQNLPMKKDKKTKKDVRDFQKNPYRSFPRGSNHLWILTGATQTKTAKLSETEFIQLAMAAKNTRRCFEDGKKVIFTDEDVHVRNYYRSCDSHWVYETTGTQDGILPFALFMSTDKQLFVRKAIEYISNAGFKLDVCVKNYYNYDKSDLRPSASFSYTMYNYLGINGEQNGLFRQIADANKKSDLDTLWSKLTKHIVTTAMEVFTQYLIPAKTADYYKQRTDLRKELYGNKGAKLYVTDNKQESKS